MDKAPRQTFPPQRVKLAGEALTAPIRRIRFAYVALFFCAWTGLIAMRLGWLQVVRHSDFVHRAAMQQQRTFEVAPRRGMMYDRNLRELAVTVQADSVFAVPSELGDNRASAAEILAEIVHADLRDNFTSKQQMLARFNASKNFAWVARRLDAGTAERVRELNLKGVYFQKEFKRFYPNSDLAAQVLGYVGTDDLGLGGLEQKFDEEMHGEPGHMLTAVDAKRHVLGSEESQPMPGENLVLSIDANIQYMAERALDAQVDKVKALHGTVVVQDPHTGQVLALAVSPRFNPNDSKHMDASVLKNLAVSDVYEPGSTFKLVTYSAALDAAGVQPTDIVDCQGGAMTMYGRTLHDDRSDGHLGQVTVQYALEHSSDVGAAKMALKVGNQKFYDYMRAFGFGDRSGIELPSETRGLLRNPKKWGATSILSMAIGQEIGVTPVQLVTMVSTIANGGVYMPPHVLLQSTDVDEGRCAAAACGVPAVESVAGDAAGWGAPGDLGDDFGEDADDDAGDCGGGNGQGGCAERVQLGRQDRDGAEDRCGDAHVFAHEAGGELCGICSGEQSGDLRCGGDRYADGGREQVWRSGECARVCECGATGAGVSWGAARSAAEDEEGDAGGAEGCGR